MPDPRDLTDGIVDTDWLAAAPTGVTRLMFVCSQGRWVKLEVRDQDLLLPPEEFSRRYLVPMLAAIRD